MRKLIIAIVASISLITFSPLSIHYSSGHPTVGYIDQKITNRPFTQPLKYTAKSARCLTEAIYYEAGNQPVEGKEAVAIVVINRLQHRNYPSTICGVVYDAKMVGDKKICQFSFTCFPTKKPSTEAWNVSKQIAERILQNFYNHDILQELDRALWFHANYVTPDWAKKKVFITQIGEHLFYRDVHITKGS